MRKTTKRSKAWLEIEANQLEYFRSEKYTKLWPLAKVFLVMSNRGDGKTTDLIIRMINEYENSKSVGMWIYKLKSDRETYGKYFLNNMVLKGFLHKGWMCNMKGVFNPDGEQVIYFTSLNEAFANKQANYTNIKNVVLDEFNSPSSVAQITDKVDMILGTVLRETKDAIFWMLGNPDTLDHPILNSIFQNLGFEGELVFGDYKLDDIGQVVFIRRKLDERGKDIKKENVQTIISKIFGTQKFNDGVEFRIDEMQNVIDKSDTRIGKLLYSIMAFGQKFDVHLYTTKNWVVKPNTNANTKTYALTDKDGLESRETNSVDIREILKLRASNGTLYFVGIHTKNVITKLTGMDKYK